MVRGGSWGRVPKSGRAAALILLGGLGCGARSTVESAEDEGANGGSSSVSRGGGGGQAAPDPVDTNALPECVPGFQRFDDARECRFLFDNRCYETSEAACACACPRGGASRCVIGGFLNPDAPQTVSCFSI
jgi:hypothetical protein